MTTSKPLFVRGLAQSEPVSSSASRPSRKSDATFADMLEARGNQSSEQQSAAQSNAVAAESSQSKRQRATGQTGNQAGLTDQMKNQALDALTKLMDSDPSNGGVYKPQNISAMRTMLSSTLTLPESPGGVIGQGDKISRKSVPDQHVRSQTPMQGIALPDRTRGIAIDVRQQRSQAVHNIALNRNRPRQSEEIEAPQKTSQRTPRSVKQQYSEELGSLAARYESGSDGIAAVGYDRNGGTSYGKYQIASRPGSMAGFLSFLEQEAPDIAQRLNEAGPANTGSRKGQMPDIWKSIAAEEPDRFEELQERFIHQSHYEPALNAVQRAGYDVRSFSPAMKEVLWSTAVQHGPSGAASIFAQAAEEIGLESGRGQQRQEKEIINEIYALRANKFGSSTPQIQAAARQRMESEKTLALALTNKKSVA